MTRAAQGARNHFFILFIGGLMGGCAWLVHPVFAVFMWVPLLWVQNDFDTNSSLQKIGQLNYFTGIVKRFYFFFFIWNSTACFWLFVDDVLAGAFAMVCIPALMTLAALLAHVLSLYLSSRYKELFFIGCWLSYEFLQIQWDTGWSWLTLGNSLSPVHYFVQWYEYTGVLGGSLWILGTSALLFLTWQHVAGRKRYALALATWLLLPAGFSVYLYYTHTERGVETEIVVVQPDLDPLTEKISGHPDYIPIYKQNQRLSALTKSKISMNTDLVLYPETATSALMSDQSLFNTSEWPLDFKQLVDSLKSFPKASLLLGASTYTESNEKNERAKSPSTEDKEYRNHNSALYYQGNRVNELYHKSKLVPGGEVFPFFSFLKPFFSFRGQDTYPQEERAVFKKRTDVSFAPLICYESTFGEYVGEYVDKGATILCVITNDAYWQGTPEPKQHLMIDRLRSIEYRRSLARASHHGHSGFINQRGDFLQLAPTQLQTALKATIKANSTVTFYARHGDVLGRMATVVTILFIAILFGRRLRVI